MEGEERVSACDTNITVREIRMREGGCEADEEFRSR